MTSSKPVPVRAYVRRRHGRTEHVCKHFRSYPHRQSVCIEMTRGGGWRASPHARSRQVLAISRPYETHIEVGKAPSCL